MKKYLNFFSEKFSFFFFFFFFFFVVVVVVVVKFSVCMNRRVFVMNEVSHAYAGLYFKFVP